MNSLISPLKTLKDLYERGASTGISHKQRAFMSDAWECKVAGEDDVEATLQQLTAHMNGQKQAAFRDKLIRYVRKPDRDLILAMDGRRILGLVCVIHPGKLPPGLQQDTVKQMRNFACGTQLLVHPSVRGQGVGSSLHLRAEHWARRRGCAGFWHITHRKANWFKTTFGFKEIDRIQSGGVEKVLMAKKLD
jgi:GNAT superfamily N-acetyltransferase